ncbi:MAG TPA: ABC transporter substrate-binding protein [Longimicrobiales bacterium]|nr:ABC transporter substrate-binding protein [Longimicrobiales bacterium]
MNRIVRVGLVLALSACGRDEEPETYAVANDPFCLEVMPRVEAYLARAEAEHPTPDYERYGGRVVAGAIGELRDGLMVLTTTDHGSTQHQQFVALMPLIEYDEALQPKPYLAESWEVDDALTEITFHLRQGVFWHDGEPTTARDVAFTYVRATDPETLFPNAAYWSHYVPGPEGVEVVDDHTVKVRMRPHAEFMDPWRTLAILPEHLLGDVPPAALREHPYGSRCPVGNGPFVFREHRDQDRWVFTANPAFPTALGGRPYLDSYVYRIVPDESTLLNELLAGSVDVFVAPRPDQARQILEAEDLRLLHAPFRDFIFAGWNARRPQLADARVRRALTLGTDRQQIVDALLEGYGRVANSTLLPAHWAYDSLQASALPYDPAAARALLEEAGWSDADADGVRERADGTRLAVTLLYNQGNQARKRIAEIMQMQLREIGVEATPQVLEWGALIDKISNPEQRDFDGVVLAWVGEFRVDDTGLFHTAHVDGPNAYSGTRNRELDRLLDTLGVVADRSVARPLWARYEQVLAQEQPYTFLYFRDRLMGVRNAVQGMVLDARGEWVNVKDWWVEAPEG